MPPPWGMTPTGFNPMTLDEALTLLQGDVQGIFGAGSATDPRSNFGQLCGVIADPLSSAWAMGADVFNAGTPDGAAGAALDFINGIRGVLRLVAEPSLVGVTLTGNPSTSLSLGQIIAVTGLGTQFETQIAATIPAASPPAWASSTTYAQGAVIASGTDLYIATTGGVSSSASGPSGYASTIPDNSVIWAYAGELVSTWTTGTAYAAAVSATGKGGARVTTSGNVFLCSVAGGGNSTVAPTIATSGVVLGDGYTWIWLGAGTVAVDVPCESVLDGPQAAGAGSLTTIATPVSGWLGAYNVSAAAVGQNLELDDGGVPGPGYRLRAEQEIRAGGSGYLVAIQTSVLNALIALNEDYSSATVTVIENTGDVPDGNGRPAHSFEVIAGLPADTLGNTPAAQLAIANAIYLNKPAGIATCSEGGTTESVVITDSQGNQHTILFSVTASTTVYASLTAHIDTTVITEPSPYTNTKAAVAALMSAFTAGLGSGRNFAAGAVCSQAFGLNAAGQKPGVLDVTLPFVGTAPGPAGVYVAIDLYHYASLPVGNVAVTVVADDL